MRRAPRHVVVCRISRPQADNGHRHEVGLNGLSVNACGLCRRPASAPAPTQPTPMHAAPPALAQALFTCRLSPATPLPRHALLPPCAQHLDPQHIHRHARAHGLLRSDGRSRTHAQWFRDRRATRGFPWAWRPRVIRSEWRSRPLQHAITHRQSMRSATTCLLDVVR